VIPALHMSEQDRYQNDLEESTERFIHQTTRELIEDLGQRENLDPGKEMTDSASLEEAKPTKLAKVLCVPVRDDADEIGAIMLGQLIERAGLQAVAIPVRRVDEVLATAAQEEPEIVFLSGMPPFAMARARRLYKSLHARMPHLKILIGIWNYTDDETKAAQEISRGGEEHISTTMAQALAQIRTFLGETDHSEASSAEQASLIQVHSESAA
jgi:methylmalonyl-CoA mutase cobalamin-binding subunit